MIFEKTGVLIGIDEIATLCEMWGCKDSGETASKIESLSKDELVKEISRMRRRRKRDLDLFSVITETDIQRAYV